MDVKLWNFNGQTSQLVMESKEHKEFVSDLDFSRFERGMLVSGSLDF